MTEYNLVNIRALLTEGFTDEELRRLCYDVPDFRPVYDSLARHSGKAEIVDRLLEYAERKLLLDVLLSLAKKHNSARYKEHQPYDFGTKPQTKDTIDTLPTQDAKRLKSQKKTTIIDKLVSILRDPIWQAIGVIIAVLACYVSINPPSIVNFNSSTGNPIWS